MDNRLGIKTFEEIHDMIMTKIMRDPTMLQKQIDLLTEQINELDEEIRKAELEAKYSHTLKKTIEFDFYRNLIQYTETAPDGTIVLQNTRGFKPRDMFDIPKRDRHDKATDETV